MAPPPKKRDANWIDGLRGVASFIVVTGHLCTAFVPYLHDASAGEGQWPLLFQYPILRLCVAGRAAVAMFFILTGYVNSLNPIKNSTNGNFELALSNLAKSTFTRSGRLVFPTNVAAFVAWLFCQVGASNLARRVDSPWIRMVTKEPGPTFWQAIKKLMVNLTFFWHNGDGTYDPTHWSIVYFLQGSMRLYLVLLATMLVKTKWRMAVVAALYIFGWCTSDYIMGINIYCGLLLAQLQTSFGSRATSTLPKFVPVCIILLGLIIVSFPQEHHDWMTWSWVMRKIMLAITPNSAEKFIGRYWVNIGCTTLFTGIFFSRNARRVLTMPLFNFLGSVSFPVYLLHASLIRTLLVWMVYGFSAFGMDLNAKTEDGKPVEVKRAGPLVFAIALPIFYVVLYGIAHLWMKYVDPLCAKAVTWLRERMFTEEPALATVEKPIPLTTVTTATSS
ncbi:hypothetical protein AJ80_00838 [Polytolypa hystricis UAMH7299]|uniref:Acyltransferase 3 domain-containing protein n=1 Tax=Polytolypa hystricis (strain UAMH7299) TaxID=1447883 RepID=A0A2B7Z1T8_POLH7|nr:hypothetical protein AJ80_00838 [Polytolypa hystricis UAMH7299]